MKDFISLSKFVQEKLAEKKIDKAFFTLKESEKREFNTEGLEFSLLRTVFSTSATIKVFNAHRPGVANGTDISKDGLVSLMDNAILSSESAPADECYDLAEKQEAETFNEGAYEPDLDTFFARIKELLADIKNNYPQILIMNVYADHSKVHSIYQNTNGTCFENYKGCYEVVLEYAGNDGENTTGIQGSGILTADLSKPFMELGSIKEDLETAVLSLKPYKMSGKFTGKVLFTPSCFEGFVLGSLFENYLSDAVLLNGTSLWKDKIGTRVASDKLTVVSNPYDKNIVCAQKYTTDGYKVESTPILENGILKTHFLSLYVANKLGKKATKSLGDGIVVSEGDKTHKEILNSIDKGIIVGAFSGGEPSASGDFSGVAKNAFYVENGKIQGALTETMINGNFGELLNNIVEISTERNSDGTSLMPYVLVDGIVVSSK